METQQIRMFATDLDSTFLTTYHDLNEENIRAVKQAREQGLIACAITARNWDTARFPILSSGFDRYNAVNNGAMIIDTQTMEPVYAHYLEPEAVETIVRAAVAQGCSVKILAAQGDASFRPHLPARNAAFVAQWQKRPPHLRPHRHECETVEEMLALFGSCATQIAIDGPGSDPELFPHITVPGEVFAAIVEAGEFLISSSHGGCLDILPYGASKLEGLQRLAALYGCAQHEIMAFGDSPNDCNMLRWAGIGVAVENAVPAVHAAADRKTGACDARGVADCIEEVLKSQGKMA